MLPHDYDFLFKVQNFLLQALLVFLEKLALLLAFFLESDLHGLNQACMLLLALLIYLVF